MIKTSECKKCGSKNSPSAFLCRSCAAKKRWETRPVKREHKRLCGINYYRQSDGYYRSSLTKGGKLLHRAIWEIEKGEIPNGWHVHHIDGNPGNNSIFNLHAIGQSEHAVLHPRKKHTEAVKKRQSLEKIGWWETRVPSAHVCDFCRHVFMTTATRVRFCSPRCNSSFHNSRRRLRVL